MKPSQILLTIGAIFMLNSCAGGALDYYKDTTPQVDIKAFFNGPVKGWGIVQDWRGRVVGRFDVNMIGKWDGDTGTLTEHFKYYDGKTQERVWTLKKLADGSYIGTASDIIDQATGKEEGSAVNWNYVMDVPVDDTTYRLRFDDWMWLMNDGVLINRSYLKKFGITVSELTIFMQKQTR
ncbi:MAG: DUF3833 domain-containing protein [Pseudomonadota bacterium]|nr:DUF3833 domain-containing protein [Pseudomonadota bacterium]